eukprot:5582513-Prymnesium_polylepis.1
MCVWGKGARHGTARSRFGLVQGAGGGRARLLRRWARPGSSRPSTRASPSPSSPSAPSGFSACRLGAP